MDRLFFIKQRRYQKNKKPASEKTVIIFISIINKTTKKAENQKNIEKQLSRPNSQLKRYKRFAQKSWVLLSMVI